MDQRERAFWIDAGAGAARNPGGWGYLAEVLKRSADATLAVRNEDIARLRAVRVSSAHAGTLEPIPAMVGGVYMMLAGLALENLLKGIRIARAPDLVQPESKKPEALLDGRLTGHLKKEMFDAAGISLDPEEEGLVSRLERFIRWAGRYPVDKYALRMAGGASISGDDPQLFETLYSRVLDTFQREAAVRQAAVAAEDALRRWERREALLRVLETEHYERVEVDGVVQFLTAEPDEPGAAVVCCCGCMTSFTLNRARPAAICPSGILYHCTIYFDGFLGREMPRADSYPPD